MERNCEACKYYVTSKDGKTKGCSQWICENFTVTTEECIEVFEGMKKGVFPWLINPYCDKAISALKQYDGKTNGEIIEALFPREGIWKDVDFVEVVFKGETHTTYFSRDFWDSPYKKGGAE